MLADATAETERLIKETTVAVESVIREETIRMMAKDWTGLVDMNKPSDGDHAKVKAMELNGVSHPVQCCGPHGRACGRGAAGGWQQAV